MTRLGKTKRTTRVRSKYPRLRPEVPERRSGFSLRFHAFSVYRGKQRAKLHKKLPCLQSPTAVAQIFQSISICQNRYRPRGFFSLHSLGGEAAAPVSCWVAALPRCAVSPNSIQPTISPFPSVPDDPHAGGSKIRGTAECNSALLRRPPILRSHSETARPG